MFVDTMPNVGSTKERLMKALDLTDEQEFRALLTSILTVPDKDVMKELACFLHQQRSRPADQPASSRRYLVDAASIRAHFSLFKETAVPKTRMDMWKLLSRALIKYERILRGNKKNIYKKKSLFLFTLFPFFNNVDRSVDVGSGYSNTDQIALLD